jgi:hypothetical protein
MRNVGHDSCLKIVHLAEPFKCFKVLSFQDLFCSALTAKLKPRMVQSLLRANSFLRINLKHILY